MHLRSSILKRPGLVFLCAGLLGPAVALAQDRGQARASAVDSSVDFNRDIRPILAGRCFTCHGPDAAKRKGGHKGRGGMRLDTSGGSRADLGDRRAVVPGRPEASELLRRIQATDGRAYDKLIDRLLASPKFGEHYARHWLTSKGGGMDRAVSGLITDLKLRGLLDDTLVVCGGEFGRTPFRVGRTSKGGVLGRDHYPDCFTMFFAGGGMKAGLSYGSSDELGFSVAEKPVHVHDLQATIMHLLGFDHERLTFRHQGRDYRLTDVHGKVVHDLLA